MAVPCDDAKLAGGKTSRSHCVWVPPQVTLFPDMSLWLYLCQGTCKKFNLTHSNYVLVKQRALKQSITRLSLSCLNRLDFWYNPTTGRKRWRHKRLASKYIHIANSITSLTQRWCNSPRSMKSKNIEGYWLERHMNMPCHTDVSNVHAVCEPRI